MNMEWFAAVSGSDGKANLDCKDAETAPLMGDGIAEDDRHLNRVNTPLLMNRSGSAIGQSSVGQSVVNLMNTYIGAGMMSLPRLSATLGTVWGSILLAGMAAICGTGAHVVAKASHNSGYRTYSQVVKCELGAWAGRLCQASVLLNNFGSIVIYLTIMGDVLVGKEASRYNGVLPTIVGDHSGEAWYLSRWFVMIVVIFFFLQPLVVQKRLHDLAGSSAIAVALAYTFGAFIATLAIVATVKGKLEGNSTWLNSAIVEESEGQNCNVNMIFEGGAVSLVAFIAIYNVPPLMAELKLYTLKRMNSAIWISIGFTLVLYLTVSILAAAIFGTATDGDILVNLSKASLSKYTSSFLAGAISYVITLGYVLKLMFIYPLVNWCLREVLSTLSGGPPRPEGVRFYIITYGATIMAYVVSLYVKSIYTFCGFISSLACSILACLIPGLIVLRQGYGKYKGIALASLFLLLGGVIAFHGTVAQAWSVAKVTPFYCSFH